MAHPDALVLRKDRVHASFTASGIELAWSHHVFPMAWSEIQMVSLTPSMVRGPDGWNVEHEHSLEHLARFGVELTFVVFDRRVLLARAPGWWARVRLYSLFIPMLDANDRYLPDQALFRFDANPTRIAFPLERLLDLVAAHCKLGLVCCF